MTAVALPLRAHGRHRKPSPITQVLTPVNIAAALLTVPVAAGLAFAAAHPRPRHQVLPCAAWHRCDERRFREFPAQHQHAGLLRGRP